MEPDIMPVSEVAAYLRCHECTVYRHTKSGELRAFRIGTDLRYLRSDIEAYPPPGQGATHQMTRELFWILFDLSDTIGRVQSALTDGSTAERRKELADKLNEQWKQFLREFNA
jgi:excisionase family DNA binding protein